jgi:hypothetical protein
MLEGKMFAEFRAESREVLEGWLKTEGMHFDWLVRLEWETHGPDGNCITQSKQEFKGFAGTTE